MSSPVPAIFAVPVIVFVVLVAAGRRMLLHHTMIDRLLNRALAWAAVGLVLWERGIAPQIGSLTHQLAMGALMLETASLYGTARLWAGADPATARARQRIYDLAGAVTLCVILIVGTSARAQGRLLGQSPSWEAILVWAIMWFPLLACGRLVWRSAMRELRCGEVTTAERLLYVTLLATMVVGCGGLALTAVQLTDRWPIDDPQLIRWAGPAFGATFLGCSILAVPLIAQISTVAGWDRTGRHCRTLSPLWLDLTTAVPEIVLPPDKPIRADARLLRMTVEIRDALMQLHRYLPADPATLGPPTNERYAWQLKQAIAAKRGGTAPATVAREADRFGAPSNDIDADIRRLLDLARAWSNKESRTATTLLTKFAAKPSMDG
ncbi:MAB_1171c family putative transporter [Nocardia sp. NPDC051756]|uniref:MAB_1171c family putative transporter n=1 Tax=Nocardia sp. NPDC051756 TaxID=3154751 RepID=UPI00341D501D